MQILVVDDNKSDAFMLRRLLTYLGFQDITEASNGREALRYLQMKHFDLMITDWRMARMDGVALVRKVRASEQQGRPRTPIIMLTAHDLRDNLTTALSAGVDDYIIKPPTLDILKSKIERVLGTGTRSYHRR
ncbi:MAG: response regulator [Rhodothermales bacterium]